MADNPEPGLFGIVTIEMVDASDWKDILRQAESRRCPIFSSAFERASKQAQEYGELDNGAVYRLTAAVFQFGIYPSDSRGPYIPEWQTSTGRTPLPQDFEDQDFLIFAHLATNSDDPTFKARLYDVLWNKLKHQNLGQLAVENYLASAQSMLASTESLDQVDAIQSLERACQIGRYARLDADGPHPCSEPMKHLRDTYCTKKDFLSANLVRLIFQYHLTEDPQELAEFAVSLADNPLNDDEFRFSQSLWDITDKLWQALGNQETSKAIRLNVAQNAERLYREHKTKGDDALLLSYHLSHVVEAYRRAGGEREKVDALVLELKEERKNGLLGMKTISASLDISSQVDFTRNLFAGKDIVDALFTLGRFRFLSREEIEKLTKEDRRSHPLLSIIPRSIIDDYGNLTASPPTMTLTSSEDVDKSLEAEMYAKAGYFQSYYGYAFINTARIEIMRNCREFDLGLTQILLNNPLIPEGREEAYFRGIKAGFEADWLVSIHLLMPQLEHSIRKVIADNGVKVTGSSSRDPNIQNEYDLGTLLYDEGGKVIAAAFGDDLLFELRVLLIDKEKQGLNLRNLIAHGLCFRYVSADIGNYFLWLVLRMIIAGAIGVTHAVDTSVTRFHRITSGVASMQDAIEG